MPTIISNLRRELETQLSVAAEGAFPGKGETRSSGAMGAFVESLEVNFSVSCFLGFWRLSFGFHKVKV